MYKFENALQDLEDLETHYDSIMAKINLENMEVEAYKITTKMLSMDSNKSYANCLNEI